MKIKYFVASFDKIINNCWLLRFMSIPAFCCDIKIKPHNCADPLVPIKLCSLCQKRTCGWTRCSNILEANHKMIGQWVLCLECSRRQDSDPVFSEFCKHEREKYFVTI